MLTLASISFTIVDAKFCTSFDSFLKAGGVSALKLPARSPNLNAFAERWVRSVKRECLSRLILFGEASLKRALAAFGRQPRGRDLPGRAGSPGGSQHNVRPLLKVYYSRKARRYVLWNGSPPWTTFELSQA